MNRKYRKIIIAGNWKMNKTAAETRDFARELKELLPKKRACEVLLCVPSINIHTAKTAFKGGKVSIGAQTMHYEDSGAFTGEISADMLVSAGVKYVIIGHSERREYYGETDETVNLKIRSALSKGLTPILCVGENLRQRENGVTEPLLDYQLAVALSGVSRHEARRLVVAYEPIWAIGSGDTATASQAQAACSHIRGFFRRKYDARAARAVSILYGGSMNCVNAAGLLAMPDIDGGLIGGSSLLSEEFAKIIEAAGQEQE